MSDLVLILIAYSPLLLIIVALVVWNRFRKKTEEVPELQNKKYELQDLTQHKDRVLNEAAQSQSEYASISNRLMLLMEKEKLYINPEIRLGDVAEKLLTNKSYLSKAIKETTNRNFCQLVHYYRIKEVMRLFAKDPEQNIQDLAFKVGFNSSSTFNIAFGRIAGFTPAEWSRDYRSRNKQPDASKSSVKTYSKN